MLGEALMGLNVFPKRTLLLESYEQLNARTKVMPLPQSTVYKKRAAGLPSLYAEWGSLIKRTNEAALRTMMR